ncbi:MAG: hypothetical protein LBC68_07255 [Prevotellaceae bacterium]|nr:hypothetical protein [Prevotellaceae bacterium]
MSDKKICFQKLTPINNAELDIYQQALDYVFENSDIKNVAISGAYGAGKSSILESYKKIQPKKQFLHISLAHFIPDSVKDRDNGDVKESVLEGKLLNQLIHKIEPSKIPQTLFKVKQPISLIRIVLLSLVIIFFFIVLLHFVFFENWRSLVESLSLGWVIHVLSLTTQSEIRLLSGLLGLFCLAYLLFSLIKAQKIKNLFRKFSFQGNEIEIFEEDDDSYFDKYLNEVLYLFENIEADVVVFEDLDRFNSSLIFERLHEINTLINEQKKRQKSPLRFFYLLRDDIFVSKDRTKFFDFIVPIVPVVDSSNSYDKFVEIFSEGDIFKLFDVNFLQGLSLYIDDMRILKNIYNEFLIYDYRISNTEQDCNKMLAIITYKNVFPRDFADLQLNRGFVYALFDHKGEFIKSEIDRITNEIKIVEVKIDAAEKEHLQSINEVDKVYQDRRNSYNEKINKEIASRKEAINNRDALNSGTLKENLTKLKNEKNSILNKKMKEILSRENIDKIFKIDHTNEIGEKNNFNEIKSSEYFDLLKYLIRNGYIDETYSDYMTYFYANNLSKIDKIFLRSVTDKRAKESSYSLEVM